MGLSCAYKIRVVEILLCALAVFIAILQKGEIQPYSVWCEFVWAFAFIVAMVILVLEVLKLELVVAVFLQHSWADLATGLTLVCAAMLLTASIIYPMRVMHCTMCFLEVVCTIVSCLATLLFLVDGVMTKKEMSSGYLTAVCGVLRFTEALLASLLFITFASYFLSVTTGVPWALGWCVLVYIVCFVLSVLMMMFNLVKLLNALVCVDKLEVVFNIVAVVLYITAIILWPIYGKQDYYNYMKWDTDMRIVLNYGYHYIDLMLVLVLTAVNLVLYIVDMILSLLAFLKCI
ncbi:myeloid-associated differentiation marker-like protein 2 [Alosa pseudoharengus]|uniref:myeloid-associated differentiation marker-like protein 2 n=1 Tax=Alosa pseudoharengus TaxID=34774 RepID=UPI003F89B442